MEDQNAVEQVDAHNHPDPTIVTDSDYSPPRGLPFPVVGVGASAGGLDAFAQLLAAIPEDSGMAFVLVQHLNPQHESQLTEILAPAAKMPVETVYNGLAVQPNHVYVIPPNKVMELRDGHLHLTKRPPGLHWPIDIFFRSLAEVQGSRAIGIVLSGNASDGSLGLRAIKAECGMTFAQDEATARFSSMPRHAAATGAVDYVLPPAEIGRELSRLGHHRFLITPDPGEAQAELLPEGESEMRHIFALLQTATKVDFSQYKPTTIRRRIGCRMMILHLETLAEYAKHLQQYPAELRELYKDLLISVTSFFREPASFEALGQLLTGSLQDRGPQDGPMRIWVPGCATGEEVYSFAICLYELLQEHQLSLSVQLFGTDISEIALERARQGIYPALIAQNVSPERLRRFFSKVDSGYQIHKMIRESCLFARHDVTRDPPFSRLDLVSCRNVLIYLEAKAQRRILPTFHYALKPTGLLMLGSAETTGATSDLFAPLDKTHHIYARKAVPTRMTLDLSTPLSKGEFSPGCAGTTAAHGGDFQKKLDRLVQTKYSPDAVVVNAEWQIVQFRGHTSPYLDPSPGEATLHLLRMAKESLLLPLRRAVQQAAVDSVTVRETGVRLENNGQPEEITIEVTPFLGSTPSERYFLIVFLRDAKSGPSRVPAPLALASLPVDEQVQRLQRELAETREYLRNLTEEYEAHAEELRAANEEARSANEELQSANEELGTTKEELQSANEELTTVNEELYHRNQDLGASNSDLKNFLSAVHVTVLIVDHGLRVRRFNAAAEKLLELSAVDLGRPVGHLRGSINTSRLEQQIQTVLESLHVSTEEVQDGEGRWYSLTVRPYRTVDDRIAGAVVTFQDIDLLKRGLQSAEEAREYAEAVIETVREPLVILDGDLRVQHATASFYETFMVSREETEGRFLYDLGNGQWNQPRLRELLGRALFRSEPFQDFELEHEFPHLGRRTMRLNARRIPRRDSQGRALLLAIEDTTERRELAEIRFQRMFETAKDGMVVMDGETGSIVDVNAFFLELTGFAREDFVGKAVSAAGALLHLPQAGEVVAATREAEIVRYDDVELISRDGRQICVDVVANRYMVGGQPVIQLNIRDISARKEATKALAESEARFRLLVDSTPDYAMFQMDESGTILTWNTGAQRLLGWSESEAVGQPNSILFVPEDVQTGQPQKEIEEACTQGRAEDERWHRRKDGSRFFASGVLAPLRDETGGLLGFAKIMRDVTERREQEDQLRRSVEEKSLLVREIHHRVKNNLQMIVSLLSLQAAHTQDPHVLTAFEETEGRVRAVARIHERLYASEDLTTVEFASYVTTLAQELITLHATVPGGVTLEIEAQDMALHIEQAIPLGLIANELILNSLKHGLKRGAGRLQVHLHYRPGNSSGSGRGENYDEGWAELRLADSGPGLPPGLDLFQTPSLGFRLVKLLVRQLGASFEIGAGPGASFTIAFPLQYR